MRTYLAILITFMSIAAIAQAEVRITNGVIKSLVVESSVTTVIAYGVKNGDGSQVYNGDNNPVTYQ